MSNSEQEERISRRAQQKRQYENDNREKRNKRKRSNQLSVAQVARHNERSQAAQIARKNGRTAFQGAMSNVEHIESFDVGDLTVECRFCCGLSFANEIGRSKHSCCHGGKVIINSLQTYPESLHELLFETNERSRHFRENIRIYNNAFAFASFNSKKADIEGRGPYCMRVIGEVQQRATTSLLSNEIPRYGQVYIYDDNETARYRMNKNLREDILLELQKIFRNHPYAKKYRQLYEVYQNTNENTVSLNFVRYSNNHKYCEPSVNAVAAIILTTDGSIPDAVDVKVFPKSEQEWNYLSNTSHHSDPMLFPLLFPNGEHGWSYLMKNESGKNISPLQYYSQRLTIKRGHFNPILCYGRLTQQFIINSYVTVESQRLKYLRFNQGKLRTECYQGLLDHVANSEANTADRCKLGNVLILPSTFQGSFRSMQQLYQDAMAICRKIGRPDLFITMTCNPTWPEISRYLKEMPLGTTANDIPHFTSRVFYQKVTQMIKDLDTVFGSVKAYVYTIEFQKRGLPHIHLLVTLQNKLLTADDVDKFICAEIPDREQFPSLWYKVTKHMLHGPHLKGLACFDIEKQSCTKNFPKQFIDNTDMTNNGFPKYRRRDNRSKMNTYHGKKNGKIITVDNSMVVPFNPYLLMKYDCHLNVEYCSSVMSIKYIHKYIHKGHDRARINIRESDHENDSITDEIKDFVDTRYLSAQECAWRLLELPMHGRSHPVERLPIHLPGMNRVVFEDGKEINALNNCNTKLTAFFELNKVDCEARSMKYEDIPLKYCWNAKNKVWCKRQRSASIVSRLVSVSSRAEELFHLKLLLRKALGPQSFADLRKVNSCEYPTFKEAAYQMGLISSDTELIEVLTEASSLLMPSQLRHFFVYILIGCVGVNGSDLWMKFRNFLAEDTTEENALIKINEMLENENSSLSTYGIVIPNISHREQDEVHDTNMSKAYYENTYKMLNEDQRRIFDNIAYALETKEGCNCFYVNGCGGSGKTFLYKCFIHYLNSKGKRVFTMAWTGIAAILLPFGKTAHKSFQLPLNLQENSTLYWNDKTKHLLKQTDAFIWDEASMIPLAALDSIDIALRDICNSTTPFGGKLFLLGGDFRQVLPVVKKAGKSQIINSTIKSSRLWNSFNSFKLTKNMRASNDDNNFSEWLLSIGNGDVENFIVPREQYCEDLVETMYGSHVEISKFRNQAILSPRNDDVYKLNNRIIKVLPGEMVTCYGIDKVLSVGTDNADDCIELTYPIDYVNSLTPSGFPPQKLLLKIDAIVMLIRNLCVRDGLCNGTRLIVKGICRRLLSCQILTGDKAGDLVYIPRINLDSSADSELPFILQRIQFPVRLAFAMTINKSQGQSFDKVGIYIKDEHPIFSHGQLYVALSRCKTFSGIKIQLSEENKNREIKNIVYKDVLN